MSEDNNGAVDRHGRVMEAIGGMKAALDVHVHDEAGELGLLREELATLREHVAKLDAALSAGTMLARFLRFTWPYLVALIGAVWWLSDHFHRLFPGRP